jgi:hypothetical protein
MQLFYIISIIILNSGIIRYDFFFFGLINFSYTVHILLSSFIIFKIIANSISDSHRNVVISKTLFIILIYLLLRFCHDFYIVGSLYQDYALPTMFSQVLSFVFIYVLYKVEILRLKDFVEKMQIAFFFLGLLTLMLYFQDPSKARNLDLWSEEFGFMRFRHGFYHLSMVSLYISCIQLFVKHQEYKTKIVFTLSNIFIQLVSITLTNYRASMGIAFGFIFVVLFGYMFLKKRYGYIIIVLMMLMLTIFMISSQNNISGAFARLLTTESVMDDPNMIWRLLESKTALDQMDTIKDIIFGVGYLKPFYLDNYKIFFLHNGYISLFYNYGLIAVVLFGFLIWWFMKIIIVTIKKELLFGLCSLTYIIGLLLQNFSSGIFTRDESAILAFGIFLFIFDRLSRDNSRKTEHLPNI